MMDIAAANAMHVNIFAWMVSIERATSQQHTRRPHSFVFIALYKAMHNTSATLKPAAGIQGIGW
jgi:hypothetical protein